ncbi:MAG: hypothetical protein ACF788_08960 [Novipirellula sp. JB048]
MKLDDSEPARILAHGIDGLVLALDVNWRNDHSFEMLGDLKSEAKAEGVEQPMVIQPLDGTAEALFNVQPHGARGHEWLLISGEMSLRIGSWLEPGPRPSVMAELRSETLWTHGPHGAVARLRTIIGGLGGQIVHERASRVDPCVDVLVPASLWRAQLLDHIVTRAAHAAPFFRNKRLTGLQIGKGTIMCRMYDKPLEIVQQSSKFWMWDVWGVESIDKDHRIIRVEFQLKRQAIKDLGIDTFADLMENMPGLWAYCTSRWLRMVNDASHHHTMQQALPWWSVVRGGGSAVMEAHPLIRAKAIRADEAALARALIGYLSSWAAVRRQHNPIGKDEHLNLGAHMRMLADVVMTLKVSDTDFTERVKRKQAKLIRQSKMFEKAYRIRAAKSVSSGLTEIGSPSG